jgi:uncharacterized cupredoxin-like copper-binding protein
VTLTDALRIEPAAITVRSGELVRFIVTNTGATEHEFYLGDEAAQQAHESEMAAMGGMLHDEPAGIALKPRETKELIFAFPQIGVFYAGCHVNGHYAGGMRAAVTVTR